MTITGQIFYQTVGEIANGMILSIQFASKWIGFSNQWGVLTGYHQYPLVSRYFLLHVSRYFLLRDCASWQILPQQSSASSISPQVAGVRG